MRAANALLAALLLWHGDGLVRLLALGVLGLTWWRSRLPRRVAAALGTPQAEQARRAIASMATHAGYLADLDREQLAHLLRQIADAFDRGRLP